MQRVLLSCKSIDDARFLKSFIETELPYEVFLAFDPAEVADQLSPLRKFMDFKKNMIAQFVNPALWTA